MRSASSGYDRDAWTELNKPLLAGEGLSPKSTGAINVSGSRGVLRCWPRNFLSPKSERGSSDDFRTLRFPDPKKEGPLFRASGMAVLLMGGSKMFSSQWTVFRVDLGDLFDEGAR